MEAIAWPSDGSESSPSRSPPRREGDDACLGANEADATLPASFPLPVLFLEGPRADWNGADDAPAPAPDDVPEEAGEAIRATREEAAPADAPIRAASPTISPRPPPCSKRRQKATPKRAWGNDEARTHVRFCEAERPKIVAANPEFTVGEVAEALRARWRGMSDAERAEYAGANAWPGRYATGSWLMDFPRNDVSSEDVSSSSEEEGAEKDARSPEPIPERSPEPIPERSPEPIPERSDDVIILDEEDTARAETSARAKEAEAERTRDGAGGNARSADAEKEASPEKEKVKQRKETFRVVAARKCAPRREVVFLDEPPAPEPPAEYWKRVSAALESEATASSDDDDDDDDVPLAALVPRAAAAAAAAAAAENSCSSPRPPPVSPNSSPDRAPETSGGGAGVGRPNAPAGPTSRREVSDPPLLPAPSRSRGGSDSLNSSLVAAATAPRPRREPSDPDVGPGTLFVGAEVARRYGDIVGDRGAKPFSRGGTGDGGEVLDPEDIDRIDRPGVVRGFAQNALFGWVYEVEYAGDDAGDTDELTWPELLVALAPETRDAKVSPRSKRVADELLAMETDARYERVKAMRAPYLSTRDNACGYLSVGLCGIKGPYYLKSRGDAPVYQAFAVDADGSNHYFACHFPTRWGAAAARDLFARSLAHYGPGTPEGSAGRVNFPVDMPWDDLVGVALAGANDALWEESEAAKPKATRAKSTRAAAAARGGRAGTGLGADAAEKASGPVDGREPASDGDRRGDETRATRGKRKSEYEVFEEISRGFANARALEKRRPRAPDRFVAGPHRYRPPKPFPKSTAAGDASAARGFSTPSDSTDRSGALTPAALTRRYEAEPAPPPRVAHERARAAAREEKGEKASAAAKKKRTDRPARGGPTEPGEGLLDAATFVETLKKKDGFTPIVSGVWCPVPADEAPGGKKNEEGRSSEVALRAEGPSPAPSSVAGLRADLEAIRELFEGGLVDKDEAAALRKKVIDAWGGGGG